jgi:hypothetical protein
MASIADEVAGGLIWPVSANTHGEMGTSRTPSKLQPLLGPLHHLDDEKREALASSRAFRGKEMAAFHFSRPSFSRFAQRNLERIITTLGHGSLRLVLLQLPARRAYIDAIKSDPDRNALYERMQDVVHGSTSEHVAFVGWEISEDCGLSEDVFVDYGHFTREEPWPSRTVRFRARGAIARCRLGWEEFVVRRAAMNRRGVPAPAE